MNIIKKCIKDYKEINLEHINKLQLPKYKSYLKILGFKENTNEPITPQLIGEVLTQSHIFNNIVLSSKPCIIKVANNSNSAIVLL